MNARKVVRIVETVHAEGGHPAPTPVTRAAVAAIVTNPFHSRSVDDLSELFELGGMLGRQLCDELVATLPRPVVSYGKAALVGALGEFEHGGALIHPKLGQPMRAAIGGGRSVIPSNVKVGAPGTAIDVPLGHKDEAWSFDHFDTMTICVADSPRPDEIMLIIAFADAGRVYPRCGTAPIVD